MPFEKEEAPIEYRLACSLVSHQASFLFLHTSELVDLLLTFQRGEYWTRRMPSATC